MEVLLGKDWFDIVWIKQAYYDNVMRIKYVIRKIALIVGKQSYWLYTIPAVCMVVKILEKN